MNNFQTPVVMPSAPSVLTKPSIKRRIDPIDAPARPLGSKRSALVTKRADSAALTAGRNAALAAAGDTLLATDDGAVTILLRATNYGLLMERTQRQGTGMRLVQTMVFGDVKSFELWCAVEPTRFEDGLLFSKLVREGHAAFAGKR
jgi:class 3 adenylate cyclase